MRLLILTKKHLLICISALFLICIISVIVKTQSYYSIETFKMDKFCEKIVDKQINIHSNQTEESPASEKIIKSIISVQTSPTSSPNHKSENLTSVDSCTPSPTASLSVSTTKTPENVIVSNRSKPWDTINNATNYSPDLNKLFTEPLELNESPTILIIHTHTTEAYYECENFRSVDESKNISGIGSILCDRLKSYGMNVIHDKTVHDYPSFMSAYSRSLSTIEKNMELYPNIDIILDIHRDSIELNDGKYLKLCCNIADKPTAQVMSVVGTNELGLDHPNWKHNLGFALKIQQKAEQLYPGLMRPINLRSERFNQHKTKCSLILEIGSNGNSYEEAKNSAIAIADVIAQTTKK